MKIVLFNLVLVIFLSYVKITAQPKGPLPLNIKNIWVWVRIDSPLPPYRFSYIRAEVIDSGVIINNKSYYKIKITYQDGELYRYCRYDSLTNFYYIIISGNYEYIYYKKGIALGDTVSYQLTPNTHPNSFYVTYISTNRIVFGIPDTVRSIYYNDYGGLVSVRASWSEKFGLLVHSFGLSNEEYLKGCVIDEVVYGDTSFPVGINDHQQGLNTDFKLEQNYPNPFNPVTTISWQSPVGGWHKLKVYDLLGNEIATILDEYRVAGKYDVEFNASSLPTGVYIYHLTVGGYSSKRKMILIK